jgi:hypothetical protein
VKKKSSPGHGNVRDFFVGNPDLTGFENLSGLFVDFI